MENGMVVEYGVSMKTGGNRFLMTFTTTLAEFNPVRPPPSAMLTVKVYCGVFELSLYSGILIRNCPDELPNSK